MNFRELKEKIIIKLSWIIFRKKIYYLGPIKRGPPLFPRIVGHCEKCDFPIFQGVAHKCKQKFNELFR